LNYRPKGCVVEIVDVAFEEEEVEMDREVRRKAKVSEG
jgi:hypothetical protein